jgi:hypothetical protein
MTELEGPEAQDRKVQEKKKLCIIIFICKIFSQNLLSYILLLSESMDTDY